jgi:hypothetical protein
MAESMIVEDHNGGKRKIKSLTDAIDTISDMGAHMNGAYVIDHPHDYTIFIYETLFPRPSHTASLKSPDNPGGLEKFLYKLFTPFLYNNPDDRFSACAPAIKVRKKEKGEFEANMLLYVKKGLTKELHHALKSHADSYGSKPAKVYYLD